MSDLMDQCFDSLLLAHVRLYHDALLRIAAITLGIPGKRLKHHRQRGQGLQLFQNPIVFHYIPGQLRNAQNRQFLSLGLGYIKHTHDLVSDPLLPYPLHDWLTIRSLYRQAGLLVDFLPLCPFVAEARGQNLYALLMGLYLSAKHVFPVVIARNMGGIRALHENQQGIAKAVMMKF